MVAVEQKHYDTLLFLDKSARPFAWGFKKAWEATHPSTPPPQIKFVNPPRNKDTYQEEYNQQFKDFFQDGLGQNVCIVDDRAATGKSFKFVKNLLRATPDGSDLHIDTFEVMSIWPSWYGTKDTGVTETTVYDDEPTQNTYSRRRQYRNSLLLVKPTEHRTKRVQQLRREIDILARRTAATYNQFKTVVTEPPLTTEGREFWIGDFVFKGIPAAMISQRSVDGHHTIELPLSRLRRANLPHDIRYLAQLFDMMQRNSIVIYNDEMIDRPAVDAEVLDFRDNPALNTVAARLETSLLQQRRRYPAGSTPVDHALPSAPDVR
jgi:hypothetical protein